MMLKSTRAKDAQKTVADDPLLASAWSAKNGDLQPDQVPQRARRSVWWRCPVAADHEWQAAPVAMKGCPFCAEAPSPESTALPRKEPPAPAPPPPKPAEPPPPPAVALRALPIDLDMLEDAFCDGALCFLSPLTGEVFLPRKWRDDCPGYVRVPNADKRRWIPDFIALYVSDPRRQAVLRTATTATEFSQRLDEREEVQWSAYSAARCGIELRAWLEKLGIRVIPRRSGRFR
jgi:hypothetical protein